MTGRQLLLIGALLTPLFAGAAGLRAQTGGADSMFADASAKEVAVRRVLEAASPAPTVLKAVRTVISDYENVVRRYPTSGYSDDALWRGAMLSRDAYKQFHETRESATALRLLQSLSSQYPSSKFAKQTTGEIAALNKLAAVTAGSAAPAAPPAPPEILPVDAPVITSTAPAAPPPAKTTAPVAAATATATPAATLPPKAGIATIKEIRRAVLQDVVRVVIELDKEVAFHDERIDGPARIFLDLPLTRSVPALVDQTVRFDADADLVRQVRLGRHPNQMTRIVLDATGVSSYSVYPLYAPFRLVVDCLRATPAATAASAPATAPTSAAAPAPVSISKPPVAVPVARAASPTAIPPAARPLPSRGVNTAPLSVPTVAPKALVVPPLASRSFARRQIKIPVPRPMQNPAFATAAAVALADGVPRVDTTTAATTAALATKPPVPPAARPTSVAKPAVPAEDAAAAAAAVPTVPPTEAARNLSGGFSIARQLGLGVSRIVIDPGHGGHDPGTKGAGTTEAEIVLDIAQKLETLLKKVPGVEVVLTRRTDEFVSLQERTAIANRENADLFLSIHANANNSPLARGVETYFLNFTSNLSAAAVAARENAASGQTMAALPDVVRTIALNNKLDESRDFATYVQREMIRNLRPANKTVKDLGVKQAPFAVLIGAAMPSVLAEISFLTNEQEARLLKGSAYRQRIATALFDAVRKYQASLKSAPGQAATASEQ